MHSNSLFNIHQNIKDILTGKNKIKGPLKEVVNYYNEIILCMPGNVYWLDHNCLTIGCNQNVLDMFRLKSIDQFLGLSFNDMALIGKWNKNQAESFERDTIEVLKSGIAKKNIEEPPIPGPKGNILYFLTTRVPIFDNNKKVIGVVGISTDISQRKKMEQDLLATKESAEVANRSKTEFLSSMSHDMKSPLVGIVSSADIIAHDEQLPIKIRDLSNIIVESGKQLASLFTSCLELSKMEMKSWTSKLSSFSIKQLINDIYALYLPTALTNHLTLEIDYDEALPEFIIGYHDILYRVILNLTGNALKFTKRGKITLQVTQDKKTNKQNTNIILSVKDTGMGIPKDQHKKIFEKFQRLIPSYKNPIQGSGIGLYIVDQYVKYMNGQIAVESNIGVGSNFIVTIPVKIPNKKINLESLSTDTLSSISKASFKQKHIITDNTPKNIQKNTHSKVKDTEILSHILVVEDSTMIQLVTKNLLNNTNFSVDIANTGEEAIAIFEPKKYGLIYMDIGLPKMNGYETTKAIRKKEKMLNADKLTPIIALTGHGTIEVKKLCGEVGMQGVLSKPLSHIQAELIWQYYGQNKKVNVPGLIVLSHDKHDVFDLKITIENTGSETIAKELLTNFIYYLNNQFLPKLKIAKNSNQYSQVLFLLHQELGSVAYVRAPILEHALLLAKESTNKYQKLKDESFQRIQTAIIQLNNYQQENF